MTGVLGFDRLRIDNRVGGMVDFALASPTLLIECVEGLLPNAALIEAAEMIVDGIPRGEIIG